MRARVRVRVRIRVRGQGRVRARVGVRVEVRAPPRKVGGASGTGRQASVARSRAPAASAAPPDAPCPRGGSWASRSGRASRCRCGRQARRCSAARAACALSPGTDVYSRSVTVTRALSRSLSTRAHTHLVWCERGVRLQPFPEEATPSRLAGVRRKCPIQVVCLHPAGRSVRGRPREDGCEHRVWRCPGEGRHFQRTTRQT